MNRRLLDMIDSLPPEAQAEVEEAVREIRRRTGCPRRRTLRQDWAGALADLKDRYTAMSLQEATLDWRGD